MAATIKIAEEFGGMTWYFPKFERALKNIRNTKMKAGFNGTDRRGLARKYKLTESQSWFTVDVKDVRRVPLSM